MISFTISNVGIKLSYDIIKSYTFNHITQLNLCEPLREVLYCITQLNLRGITYQIGSTNIVR